MDEFRVKEWKLEDSKGKKIWIPHMCDSAFVLAAALRSKGYESEVLPRSSDSMFSLGRQYTDGDQCLPSIMTTEDILRRTQASGFDKDAEAFFQGKSEGPCRFGRYYMNQQAILWDLGLENVPIITLDNRNAYGGLGSEAKIMAWDGMIAQALLERCVHFTRPLEITSGASDEIYSNYLDIICKFVQKGVSGFSKLGRIARILRGSHVKGLVEVVESAAEDFLNLPQKNEERPIVFITGEIYVRTNEISNQDLIRKIERLGGISLLEPAASFFGYVNEFKKREATRNQETGKRLKGVIENWVMSRDECLLGKACEKVLGEFAHDPNGREVMQRGERYVHPRFKGETIVSLGASDFYAQFPGIKGVINTYPFACLPGTLVKSKSAELRRLNNGIPFLNLPYDGHPDPNTDETLGVFMHQVRERMNI